ncbi:MAG: hypothetical protein HZB70_00410 [Candidatus Berkelbacteria bacterium]|nr:MAG: hypothetical protein HZB70_00410 [Candidatus Berkelbacteria bacterium]QQG51431.1 MAG: hypothetical protein HY845_02590 [Candidatus Berkelbacteria bacterium]
MENPFIILWEWTLGWLKRLALYRFPDRVDFAFGMFTTFIVLQLILGRYGLFYLLSWWPDAQRVQFENTPLAYLGCFLAFHMGVAFFEFGFHRYILHKVFWRFLQGLARKHRKHHGLTYGDAYPITEPKQIESSAFPAWTLAAFWGFFAVVALIPLQLIFPSLPWLISGGAAVAWSYWLYEVKHAVEHLDYDRWWKWCVERSDRLGQVAKKVYWYHRIHHFIPEINEAIGGFMGFDFPGWVFRTSFVPEHIPAVGAKFDPSSFKYPPPRWPVNVLDKVVDAREKQLQGRA